MLYLSEEQMEEAVSSGTGFCISCQNQVEGAGNDARKTKCQFCGKDAVYGLEELAHEGKIKILLLMEADGDQISKRPSERTTIDTLQLNIQTEWEETEADERWRQSPIGRKIEQYRQQWLDPKDQSKDTQVKTERRY